MIERPIKYIFVHTFAFSGTAGAADVDRWHKARGWKGIGYHAVIRRNGDIEAGRPYERMGAHVKGYNRNSIGISCEGHGDEADFTEPQKHTLYALVADILEQTAWKGEPNFMRFKRSPSIVLGHREAWTLLLDRRALKSCPGNKVSCRDIRLGVINEGRHRGWYNEVDRTVSLATKDNDKPQIVATFLDAVFGKREYPGK